MMLSGMEGDFRSAWSIDGKRPTNATKKDRQSQSERDKQKNRERKSQLKYILPREPRI